MARLPNFLVIIRSEKLSGKGQGRGVGVRKKERFVLGKRTFRSQKSKHFVLRIINDKDLALVKKINKGDVEDGEVLTFAGGSGWGNAATGVLLCNQDAWTAVDEEITGEPVLEGEPKAYSSGSVTLKPEGGFQVGNMYEASALIQSVPATGSLNIVIENIQSGGEINFGFN